MFLSFPDTPGHDWKGENEWPKYPSSLPPPENFRMRTKSLPFPPKTHEKTRGFSFPYRNFRRKSPRSGRKRIEPLSPLTIFHIVFFPSPMFQLRSRRAHSQATFLSTEKDSLWRMVLAPRGRIGKNQEQQGHIPQKGEDPRPRLLER